MHYMLKDHKSRITNPEGILVSNILLLWSFQAFPTVLDYIGMHHSDNITISKNIQRCVFHALHNEVKSVLML